MKRLYYFLFLIVPACFMTSSCSKADPDSLSAATPEFLLTSSDFKKWEMIDPSVALEMNKPLPVTMPACPTAEVKNGMGYFYHFYTNGTIDFQDGCGRTVTDKTLVKGTWVFNADKTSIIVNLTGQSPQTWIVTTLTVSRLIVTVNGSTLTFAPTPFRA